MATLTEESYKQLDRIQDTVWGTKLTAQIALGLTPQPDKQTTLNEKFQINELGHIESNDKYTTGFYCIGNGGHRTYMGDKDIPLNEPVDHDPLHGALYNHLPFVLRREGQDLTEEERKPYRLRKLEEYHGQKYIAYYAKEFKTEKIAKVVLEKTERGNTTTTEYQPNAGVLTPVKPTVSPRKIQRTSNTKASVDIGSQIIFDEKDVSELYNVCRIIYGDVAYAKISEIGLIMAVDQQDYQDQKNSAGTNGRYAELKGAVISTFISTMHDIVYNSDGFIEKISFGGKKPLLTIGDTTPTVGAAG